MRKTLLLTFASIASFGAMVQQTSAATIGYWRMENNANSEVNSLNGTKTANASYSTTVAAPYIYDPVANTYSTNTYSLNASLASAYISVADNALLDQGTFTWEFFIRLDGQPATWDSFLSRRNSSVGYQVDFTGNTAAGAPSATGFGRVRARWDTSSVEGTAGYNRSANGNFIYNDADNAGTGITTNADTAWHHVAMTWDGTKFQMFTDYVAGGSYTMDGPTFDSNWLAGVVFGKLAGSAYGLFMDEVRFSSGVLTPSQFLQLAAAPEPSKSVLILGSLAAFFMRRRRNYQGKD